MMRWRRLALLILAGLLASGAGAVVAVVLNVATGSKAPWFLPVEGYLLWWTTGAIVGAAVAGLLVWEAQRWYERGLSELIPAVQRLPLWVVDRPAEVDKIVAALRRRHGGTVGITTAVHGAGGFGKTTVAKIVRADRRVLRRFRARVYWVTLGRDVDKQALVGLVNGLIAQIDPRRPATFTDARQAAEQLAAVLAAGPRRLVVLDDVWSEEQLAAFPAGGRCARLVTTRIPSLAKGTSVPVKVDQMSETQARALLSAGLPPLPAAVAAGLLEETGRWPLLLRLINKILDDQAKLRDIDTAAEDLLGRLRRSGALQVDQLTEAAGQQLDVSDPDQRQQAVRATIQASTSLLSLADQDRFAELAVFAKDETIFAKDETIPVTLITALWQSTGGLDRMATVALCARLANLALLTLVRDDGTVTVHDVIREFLREELGSTRLAQLHQVLLDAAAVNLSAAMEAVADGGVMTAWWGLPETARDTAQYLREHLIEHLLAAERADDLPTAERADQAEEREAAVEIARTVRIGGPFALARIDIDHFKVVNDTYGHLVGTKALRAVTWALRSNLREHDLIRRFGEDGFAVLLPHAREIDALMLAERARAHIAAMSIPVDDDAESGPRIRLTISVGVAILDGASSELMDVLSAADAALGFAKESGHNKTHVITANAQA
jgi:diguanylate cyclase (GGDEF)-like protein